MSLALVARAHFLYVDARYLDIDADIQNQERFQSASNENDEAAFVTDVYNQAIERWRTRNGSLHTVAVTFVVEGICHRTIETVEWYDEYAQALAAAGDTLNERVAQRRRSEWAQRVQELITDPRFPLARNERQRIRLAEELNPGMTGSASSLATDAMTELWFRDVSRETGM